MTNREKWSKGVLEITRLEKPSCYLILLYEVQYVSRVHGVTEHQDVSLEDAGDDADRTADPVERADEQVASELFVVKSVITSENYSLFKVSRTFVHKRIVDKPTFKL